MKIYSLGASDSSWKVMQAAADVGRGSQVDILSVAGKVYVAYTDASGYLCVLQVSAENVQQIYRSQTAIYPPRMELLYEQDILWISYAVGNTLELINVWQPDGSLPPLTVSGTYISGTKHFFYDNKWYAVYCDYLHREQMVMVVLQCCKMDTGRSFIRWTDSEKPALSMHV